MASATPPAASHTPSGSPGSPRVQRQITLPLSKAVEIAYKSIRLRLSRSLLVTSGIILALAFLMSIRTTQAIEDSVRALSRQWDRHRVETAGAATEQAKNLQKVVKAAAAPALAADKIPDAVKARVEDLDKDFKPLPVATDALESALVASPAVSSALDQWVQAAKTLKQLQELEQILAAKGSDSLGLSTTQPTQADVDASIAAEHVRTNWLLGLALMVAFVGILNAMLMSVTERFREIGTMKCLGALNSFIIKLFLIESLFQGIIGTTIGLLLGLLLSLAGAYSNYHDFIWYNMPVGQIAGVGLACVVVGVTLTVGGALYPAWQAARMQPIEAMRVDA